MNTKFSEIYTLFLAQIDDYELASVNAEELDIVLKKYLINAIPSLIEMMEDIDEMFNIAGEEFTTELSISEKSIIAKAMKLEWLREKKYSSELMRKSVGDRDFQAVQGYNYLKEMTSLEKELSEDIRKTLINYSYREEYIGGWIN